MHDADPRLVSERSRALKVDLGLGAEICNGAHVVLVDKPADVPGCQLLQIVGTDQPVPTDGAIVSWQSAEVPRVRSSVQVNPVRIHLVDSNSRGRASSRRSSELPATVGVRQFPNDNRTFLRPDRL
jgi:hypothetical protein